MNYKNLFDSESKLMRGKQKDGKFAPEFSPLKWGGDFTEGNSWHYSLPFCFRLPLQDR